MRVILKEPALAPCIYQIPDARYETLRFALGRVNVGSCITHQGIRVLCDDDALRKAPVPRLNLIRPTDNAPVHGAVMVIGEDRDYLPLDDRQVALWMATIALIGVDVANVWRTAALKELVPRIDAADRAMFKQLCSIVALRSPKLGARW
jgi:hypothetical protein